MRTKRVSLRETAEINIVPLLDVLLVLVAVLLLLTPFMAKSINVDLPKSVAGEVMSQDTAITLDIRSDGSVWHKGELVVSWNTLSAELKAAAAAKVYADKDAPFQAVTLVLDKLAQNGIHNIQFGARD